eukprot:4250182-Pyramimonas_sp.AAC.1
MLLLKRVSVEQGVPLIVALLEVQMFLAPRILRSRNIASDLNFPTRSIVAGSARGVKLAEVFLGPILSAAHAASG